MKQFLQKIKTFFITFGSDIKIETKILFRQIADFFKSLGRRISTFFKKCGASIKKRFTVHKKKKPDESEPHSSYEEYQSFHQNSDFSSERDKNTADSATDTKNRGTKSADENTHTTKEKSSAASTDNTARHHPVIYAIGNSFDVLFDVLFAAAIVLRLKSTLFFLVQSPKSENDWIERIVRFIIETYFYPAEPFFELPSEIIFTFFCIITAYIIFKLIFALFVARGPQKIVSVLLIVAMVFTLTLTIDKFLIFLAFYFLLYFTYQLSCGIRPKIAGIKLCLIVILDICMYLVLHIISCPESFEFLRLPINGWI